MFSIIIPTLNNLKYLEKCIESINKNSKFKHELIPHVNIGSDGTIDFLKTNNIKFTYTEKNSGICEGMNLAAKEATSDYILYAHDDFYFAPNWDEILKKEIDYIGHNKFYLSGTMMHNGQIKFNCGDTIENFDEHKFLKDYKSHNFYDFQGSTWAPHIIHKEIWKQVGGFSEEFFPGTGSDPDLNMKLWKIGVRIFKGINNFRVYHFGSISLRKKKNLIRNKGNKLFLQKWGISTELFIKFYLNSDSPYNGPLRNKPKINIEYLIELIRCKIKFFFLKIL